MAGNDKELDALIREITENPEKVNDPSLGLEKLEELQRRLNPYSFAAPPTDEKEREEVIVSCTNLRDDYLRKFQLTAVSSFLFQMLKEWEVPREARTYIRKPRKKKNAPEAPTHTPASLVKRLEATLAVAKASAEKAAAAEKLAADLIKAKAARAEAEIVASDGQKAAKNDKEKAAATKAVADFKDAIKRAADIETAANAAAAEAAGGWYTVLVMVAKDGQVADSNVGPALEAAFKFPDVKKTLQEYNIRPGAERETEVPPKVAHGIIDNFLSAWLDTDLTQHVKCAREGKEAPALPADQYRTESDPGRLPFDVLRTRLRGPSPSAASPEDRPVLEAVLASRSTHTAAVACLRDPLLAKALSHVTAHADRFGPHLLPVTVVDGKGAPANVTPLADTAVGGAIAHVPPADTLHRLRYWTEVNYEELRTVTESIYHEKPDLDWMVGVWKTLKGSTEQNEKEFKAFVNKHESTAPAPFLRIDVGKWTLMGDFKKNRDNIDVYNRNTEILKRILDRHAEDEQLGKQLMKKRVVKSVAKNIREEGPHAPGLDKYRQQTNPLTSLGADRLKPEEMKLLEAAKGNLKVAEELKYIEDLDAKIKGVEEKGKSAGRPPTDAEKSELQRLRLERTRAVELLEVPENAIQVDTWTHDTNTGKLTRGKFYTEADKPDDVKAVQDAKNAPFTAVNPATGKPQQLAPYAVQEMLRQQKMLEQVMTNDSKQIVPAAKGSTALDVVGMPAAKK